MNENNSTYIGEKGYTIFKECLTIDDQHFIRENLTVRPYIPNSVVKAGEFPIYRESQNKFYIPKYFGIEHFGNPEKLNISSGDSININFTGKLRDYQIPIVDAYLNTTKNDWGGGGLLDIPCGFGKCLGKNTPIIMYDGTIKMVQDIKTGDKLMGDDSSPRNVLSLARGRSKLYKIIPNNGDSYIVNESHILSLKNLNEKIIDINIQNLLKINNYNSKLFGYRVPIYFKEKKVSLDPYILGYWLCESTYIECINVKTPFEIKEYIYCILSDLHKYKLSNDIVDNIYNELIKFNLLKVKQIPFIYKCNSRKIQLNILGGIIDSDGYNCRDRYEIILNNDSLINDILFISRSLGFETHKYIFGDYNNLKYYRISISGLNIDEIPVIIKLKFNLQKQKHKIISLQTKITIEEYCENGEYYGFTIDGNKRFLLGDFQVTHNTAMGLYIASKLQKKTIVVVHKTFLLNQWVERINEFLPNTRIGKIQGQIIDIENKDIVIAMLQSLSLKDYPQNIFKSFGLTIVDECHHISSEVFSRSLLKLVTKYTLGLSATINRKDGLTNVFKMFLGNIAYSVKRETNEDVIVKGIEFIIEDDEFNETSYDYRGNPAYSTMITKICNFNIRTEFIINVIVKELKDYPKQQMLVLGQNKSILNYLFKAIETRNIATVGYYIGGMKEKQLKESENKTIIIATYAMASEGLDIKSLSTLLLVTPRTDITQAVGRILRIKHSRPLIIDFIDNHDVFRRQWKKRLAFYKKNNYSVKTTDNLNYSKDNYNLIKFKSKKTIKNNKKCLIKLD
jgi:superfamily II DNA or RNA helicase